jgi:putative tributyrin esterase
MRKLNKFNLFFLLFFVGLFSTFAQEIKSGKVENFKLNSKLMGREMPYRVVFPLNYDQKDEKTRYPVIFLLHGLTGHFDNWTDKTKIAAHAAKNQYIFVTPEGDNGWYSDSISIPNDKYESYIIQELIPEVDTKFRTAANREKRIIAGLSMGGYGSLKFGLKYPEKFILVGSFSGALGAASWTDKNLGNNWKALTDSIMSVYGAEGSQTRKDNDIYQIVRNSKPEETKKIPFLYLDCGTEDFLIQQNRDFASLLLEKKIPHEFRQLPGKHDWNYWDSQIVEFLNLTKKIVR